MSSANRSGGKDEDLVQVLGYLNFSSGKQDVKTLQALNRLYGWAIAGSVARERHPKFIGPSPFVGMPASLTMLQWLRERLEQLSQEQSAFQENSQARHVLDLVWLKLLPDYLDFHSDLLFHQEPEGLFNGYFLGRAIEAVLRQGPPWGEPERIVPAAIRLLNDYVGFRPVAVLEGRRIEPYSHEWLRPIPVFIEGAGVAHGPYFDLLTHTLDILRDAPEDLLRSACFDINMLEELAIDPRAYDFDHPVNKRPNYHFGQWDPHCIDNQGYYRRFVIQQVTIDALMGRLQDEEEIPRDQLLYEASAVLSGTILMASAVSGWGPSAYASTVTLGSLMDPIARFRDAFYEQLLLKMKGPHADRLRAEQSIRRQAFGGARQHLNTRLARQRASQLEHIMLARLFARMGCSIAAKEESDHVQVPSARIQCRIDCLLTMGEQHLQREELSEAVKVPGEVRELLERGIQCGAIVDPWNMLGFAGNFSRFPSPDSAIHDHRVDEIVELMEHVFAFQSRLWREASARNESEVCKTISSELREQTEWWRQFAAHEVSDLEATDPKDSYDSAKLVAEALQLWNQGGSASGDIRFWAPHAALFDSPKAYALVIEALLERRDFVASMALLVHWLSSVDRVGLQSGPFSYSELARRWLETLHRAETTHDGTPFPLSAKWTQIEKFFDYIEANGESLCQAPEFRLATKKPPAKRDERLAGVDEDDDDEEAKSKFRSAYEDVVYQDSTDDGMEGATYEEETDTQDELAAESKRLLEHLTFQSALAHMWKEVALSVQLFAGEEDVSLRDKQLDTLKQWCDQSSANRRGLAGLVEQVHLYRIPRGGADQDSMGRYDRKRVLKESLLEKVISTAVDTSDASRLLLSAVLSRTSSPQRFADAIDKLSKEDQLAVRLFSLLISGKRSDVEEEFNGFLSVLRAQKLLYLPLARGGQPEQILDVRLRRRLLTHLLTWLPRQGLFYQSCQLVETARFMEHHNPVGPGAVTEFDELFQMAFKSMVRCLVRNAYAWHGNSLASQENAQGKADREAWQMAANTDLEFDTLLEFNEIEPPPDLIIPLLEKLTEVLLGTWLSHSRTLRLSILETVDGSGPWKQLKAFIEEYGAGLFHQNFLKLGNVRAILHQGVDTWLDQAAEDGDQEEVQPILDAIESGKLNKADASKWLNLVLEAVIDHYVEYRDYNSTTTQSDRGEMLYMLLDFLRLRVKYDRVSWNLKPVFWAHEVLVRCGCGQTSMAWRRALAERIGREADQYLTQLKKLQETYAMRMPTVADRLGERFIKPMTVDRMRALIRPAMKQLADSPDAKQTPAFDLLVHEAKMMMREPTGVGLDIPSWLLALEEEVVRQLEKQRGFHSRTRAEWTVKMIMIGPEEIEGQLNAAARIHRMLN